MGVALDHGQALPPAELLDRAQVYPSHDEPGGESVPVAMPRVRLQVPRGPLLRFQGLPGAFHGRREELVGLPIGAGKDERVGIVRPCALRRQIQQDAAHHPIHGHLASAAILPGRHREEVGQEVHVAPLQGALFAPSEARMDADREESAEGWREGILERPLLERGPRQVSAGR
jgi:hypothetical protein